MRSLILPLMRKERSVLILASITPVRVIDGVKSTISAVTALTRVSGACGAESLRQPASRPSRPSRRTTASENGNRRPL
jgi:hypothetical protein